MYEQYPDPQAPATVNALHLASLMGKWYEIDGFKAFLRDTARTYVGLLPAFYFFSPETGTASVYSALEEALPCMVKGLRKKPQFWLRRLPSVCQAKQGFLFCNQSDVAPMQKVLEKYIRRSNAGEKLLEKVCSSSFVVDGSTDTMLQWRSGYLAEVEFDMAVFISSITPGARFIALVPGSTVKHVRSTFFYVGKRSAAQYSKALQFGIRQLERQAKSRATCSQLLSTSHTIERQEAIVRSVSAVGNSCNILRFAILFPDRVFLSNITAFFDCSDGFREWMGELWGSQKCFPALQHERLPVPLLGEHIFRSESELAEVLHRRRYQLQPIAKVDTTQSSCKPYAQAKTLALAPVETQARMSSNANRDVNPGCGEGCDEADAGLATVNDKYAGASILVITILTSVAHMQYVDGCIALHVMLRRMHPDIPAVALVVNNVQPELAAVHSAAVGV
eukprot:1781098-Rhodomonas_salina.3